jgi:hypothetical protein
MYKVKFINGLWCVVDDNDMIVWIGNSKEECQEMIESGELERALDMCEQMCYNKSNRWK